MKHNPEKIFAARWALPITTPPIEWARLLVRKGKIEEIKIGKPEPLDINLGTAIITPALVNAHTHLDLSGFQQRFFRGIDFISWVEQVIEYRSKRDEVSILKDIKQGIDQSLRHGVGLVGDISGLGLSRDVLKESKLAAVVYFELLGLKEARGDFFWKSFQDWLRTGVDSEKLKHGVSPHAPYSVSKDLFIKSVQPGLPLQMHFAETFLEMELVESRNGRFRKWLESRDVFEETRLVESHQIIFDSLSRLNLGSLVHGTCWNGFEVKSNLIFCPRTAALFDQGKHPYEKMLKSGWKIALGTDSLASNPDLSVLNEARFLKKENPSLNSNELLRMISINGAEILGMENQFGSLAKGKNASFSIFSCEDCDDHFPEDFLLNSDACCSGMVVDGEFVF